MTDGELRSWFVVLVVVLLANIFRSFFPAYLGKKGQNLADKEDIAALTEKVEQVKGQYAEIIEAVKFRNQLRMAAIDRRMQAHQDAYRLWVGLLEAIKDIDLAQERSVECLDWWNKNCLYLEPAAREAFRVSITSASEHHVMLAIKQGQKNYEEALLSSLNRIFGAGDVIVKAVALPGLTALEAEEIRHSGATTSLSH